MSGLKRDDPPQGSGYSVSDDALFPYLDVTTVTLRAPRFPV